MRRQKRPMAWLGSVRGGKTVGGLMAMLEAMERVPGRYAVSSVGQQNVDANLTPTLTALLDAKGWDYRHYKSQPQRYETERGQIPIYLAGDTGAQRQLQGVSLQGAFSDEVLLYPRNFLMQLVARFTHDRPWWVMTANKAEPNHWLKVDWIDEGKIDSFQSGAEDNPHVSSDAQAWWDTLITGKFRDRMLSNEWAADRGLIGAPAFYGNQDNWTLASRKVMAIWLDDSLGHAAVCVVRDDDGVYVVTGSITDISSIDEIERIVREGSESRNYMSFIRNDRDDNLIIPRVAKHRPRVTDWAIEYVRSRHKYRIHPACSMLARDLRAWGWVASGTSNVDYVPDEATPAMLATIMGLSYITQPTDLIAKSAL